jgi:hypothetical protein
MVPVPATAPVVGKEVVTVDAVAFGPAASSPPGPRRADAASAAPEMSGGMLIALAMNRRARGLRGLDVLRRSQDRAPPQAS